MSLDPSLASASYRGQAPAQSPSSPNPRPCCWTHHSHGVDIRCREDAIPGGRLCAERLIAHVAADEETS